MNFKMLQNLIQNLMPYYECPFCGGKEISETNIDIVGAAGNTVNIDAQCPKCKKHLIAKTEVMTMDIDSLSSEKIQKLQQSLLAMKEKLGGNIDIEIQSELSGEDISDDTIISLQKDLKGKDLSASDLFNTLESEE